jgi:hypothetical protein
MDICNCARCNGEDEEEYPDTMFTRGEIPRGVMKAVAARASCTYHYAWRVLNKKHRAETMVTARIWKAYREIMAENFPNKTV